MANETKHEHEPWISVMIISSLWQSRNHDWTWLNLAHCNKITEDAIKLENLINNSVFQFLIFYIILRSRLFYFSIISKHA